MSIIVPTITTSQPTDYLAKLIDFASFAPAIHVDIADGQLAPSQTISLNQVYWLEDLLLTDKELSKKSVSNQKRHLHLMIAEPIAWLDQIVSLKPNLVILHAESCDGDSDRLLSIINHLKRFNFQIGLALLSLTDPDQCKNLISAVDHVLLFGGHLGYQGGTADLTVLNKINLIKQLNPGVTIGYDGGVNIDNVGLIADHQVDFINVGAFISRSDDPIGRYQQLVQALN